MKIKSVLGLLVLPLVPLLVPLIAMQFSDEVNWTVGDFVFMWLLLAGAGLAYQLATAKKRNGFYRIASVVAIGTAFLLVVVNAAVGIIGSEDNPANLLYGVVLAVFFFGAAIARLQPIGMARAMMATAGTQFAIPLVALFGWREDFAPGVTQVLLVNAVFAGLFLIAAWFYQQSARQRSPRELNAVL